MVWAHREEPDASIQSERQPDQQSQGRGDGAGPLTAFPTLRKFSSFAETNRDSSMHSERVGRKYELLPLMLTAFLGTSNLSVFPKTMMFNGGVFFLVPYLLGLVFYTIPSAQVEVYIGQFTQTTPLKGYSLFAPIMAAIVWTSQIAISIGGVQALLHMTIAMQMLLNYPARETWAKCQDYNSPSCISFANDRGCADQMDTTIAQMRYAFKDCHQSFENLIIQPNLAQLPVIEFLYNNVTKVSSNISDFGSFNWMGFAVATLITCLVAGLLVMSIRAYSYFAMCIQLLMAMLLMVLTIHSHYNIPADMPADAAPPTLHFQPRYTTLLQWTVWQQALMLSIRSQSLGQATIPAAGAYARQDDFTIKWVLLATLCDVLFSLCCTYYMDGLMVVMAAVTVGNLNPYDFDRQTHVWLHGLAVQALSYYNSQSFILAHHFFVFLVMLNSYMSIAMCQHQFVRTLLDTKKRWHASIVMAIVSTVISLFFFFENYDQLFTWFSSARSVLTIMILGAHLTLFVTCYGMSQVYYDITVMTGIPNGWREWLWDQLTQHSNWLYAHIVPALTALLLGTLFNVPVDHMPFKWMAENPVLYYLLTPPVLGAIVACITIPTVMYFKGDFLELFRPQPGLPSYKRLRVPLGDG